MSDVLSVANSAVQTYEAALSTVSNNIANATTAGYSEEQVNIVQGTPSVEGTVVLGTGASVASVTRAYDAFASENVRNSNSELQTQNAMVNYTNQVVNALGNSTTGLTTSMDSFFSAVNQLSTSPASSTYRSTLLGSASSMASNFNQVASQLSAIDTSSQQNIASDVSDINSIATELAQVNGQLTGEPSESAQPPALLDQRDSLLSQLSKYATVTTSFSNNGAVTVSIGGSLSSGVIVNGTSTTLVTQTANSENPPVISLGLSANGTTQPLTGLSGGDLSGLLTFRSQVLSPAFGQINLLANTLATQVNQTQAQGIDLDGNAGQALFTTSDSGTGAAANLQVAITNPNLIAAASPFDVSASENNPGTETASVSYQAPTSSGPGTLSQVLGNNADPAAGVAVNVSNDESPAAVTTIPAGTQNAVIYLDNPGSNQQLQILTQNGVQVTGPDLHPAKQFAHNRARLCQWHHLQQPVFEYRLRRHGRFLWRASQRAGHPNLSSRWHARNPHPGSCTTDQQWHQLDLEFWQHCGWCLYPERGGFARIDRPQRWQHHTGRCGDLVEQRGCVGGHGLSGWCGAGSIDQRQHQYTDPAGFWFRSASRHPGAIGRLGFSNRCLFERHGPHQSGGCGQWRRGGGFCCGELQRGSHRSSHCFARQPQHRQLL